MSKGGRKRKYWPSIHVICSGGGTKGASQAGSLEAITDLIGYADCYSGASAGAINAAWYALEKDPRELRKLWTNLKWYHIISIPWHDIMVILLSIGAAAASVITQTPWMGIASISAILIKLLTKKGFSSDKALRKILIKYFGKARMKDAKHRLIIKATDIVSATSITYDSQDVHARELPIVDLLLESARFPVVYEPKKVGKSKIIADGGILDNVPCDVGKEYDSNIVLWLGYTGKPKVFKEYWYRIVFKVIDAMMSEDARESMVHLKTKGTVLVKYPFLYNRGTFEFGKLSDLYIKGYNLIALDKKDEILHAKYKYVKHRNS